MTFYSVQDLETKTEEIWDFLSADGEVVITNNGKPAALIIDIPEDSFDEIAQAVRQAKAMYAIHSMRQKAAAEGFMTDAEIDTEISVSRKIK